MIIEVVWWTNLLSNLSHGIIVKNCLIVSIIWVPIVGIVFIIAVTLIGISNLSCKLTTTINKQFSNKESKYFKPLNMLLTFWVVIEVIRWTNLLSNLSVGIIVKHCLIIADIGVAIIALVSIANLGCK